MVNYEFFYEGSPYALDGNYGNFIGYRLPVSQVGTSLRPDTANQIAEASNVLNQGFRQIEVGTINSQILDTIPKQHFKEINRLMKITGAQASLHAPIQDIEASGIIENQYSELNREIVERKLKDVMDKAHQMNPDRAVPVTMHSANMGGTEFVRGDISKGEDKFKENQILAINQGTGRVETVFKNEERYYPESPEFLEKREAVKYSPARMMQVANNSAWIQKVENIAAIKKNADEVLGNSVLALGNILEMESAGQKISPENLNSQQNAALERLQRADIFLGNVESSVNSMFDEAYKYSDEIGRRSLRELAKSWGEKNIKLYEEVKADKWDTKSISYTAKLIQDKSELLNGAINLFDSFNSVDPKTGKIISGKAPQVFVPVEKFAMDKTADTFSNVALHSYGKYKDKAPIVSIENLYSGMAYSKPEDFKKVVDTSRKKFVEKAQKSKSEGGLGLSESEAKRVAQQVIGVTWDVGHLNMLRKQGFKEEDLVEATKLLAKDVKHVHLTDNFGYNDSHLAPGMGNVPIKKHLEELEKAGVLGKDGRKNMMVINEIGGFVNQFKQSPFPYMLEAFGSPVMSGGGAYWNQALGAQGNYMAMPTAIFPDYNFQSYGGLGFSALPREFGGQAGNQGSRFSGTPNA